VIKFLYCLLSSFLGAIIVHIAVLFLIPSYLAHPVMEKLTNQAEPWQFFTVDDDNPIAVRQDPALRLRVCHFDLSEEPVHLTAEGDVPFWSLSLYDNDANNLYSLSNRVMPGERLDLIIGTPIQIIDYKRYHVTDEQRDSILTQHNMTQGFVVLRAYVPSPDWEPLVETFLRQAGCNKIDS